MKKILSILSAIVMACVLTMTLAVPGFAAQTYALKTMKIHDSVQRCNTNLQYQYDKKQKALYLHNANKKEDGKFAGEIMNYKWLSGSYVPDKNIDFQNVKLYLNSLECSNLAILMLSKPFSNGKVTKLVDYSEFYSNDYQINFGCVMVYNFKRNSKGLVTEATARASTGELIEKVTMEYNNRNQVSFIKIFRNDIFHDDFVPETTTRDSFSVDYDSNHKLKSITDHGSPDKEEDFIKTTFNLNKDGTIQKQTDKYIDTTSDPYGTVDNNSYIYNSQHLVTKITEDDYNIVTLYSYNYNGCVTEIDDPDPANNDIAKVNCTYQAI